MLALDWRHVVWKLEIAYLIVSQLFPVEIERVPYTSTGKFTIIFGAALAL